MSLWRNIPAGDNPPEKINVVVEVISGSRDKYEYHIKWGAFVLDRVLHSPVVFPVDYGFMPQTWCDDEDPLDVMILTQEPFEVGCVVKTRPIGVMIMEDEQGEDPKILSVPLSDPRFDDIKDINDVSKNMLKEIQEFFEIYKRLEPRKWTKFKTWKNSIEAKKMINSAIQKFKKLE
jgi:inorganic pyrophosphatase